MLKLICFLASFLKKKALLVPSFLVDLASEARVKPV
jgi:hypothetical protein